MDNGILKYQEGKAKIDPENFLGCGRCVCVCPNSAITIEIYSIIRMSMF